MSTNRALIPFIVILLMAVSGCSTDGSSGSVDTDGDYEREYPALDGDDDTLETEVEGDEAEEAEEDATSCVESVNLGLNTNDLDFGAVSTGTNQNRSLTITADTSHSIKSISIFDDDEKPEFSIITDDCSRFVDPPGVCHETAPNQSFSNAAPYTITVSYTPLDADLTHDNALLVIETDDECNPTKRIKLSSKCKGTPNLKLSVDDVAITANSAILFEDVLPETSADTVLLKLENIGDASTNAPVWVTLTLDDNFTNHFEWTDCNPTELTTGFLIGSDEEKSCTLRFRKKTDPGDYIGKATILWNSSCVDEDGTLVLDFTGKVIECENGNKSCNGAAQQLCSDDEWQTSDTCNDQKVCTIDTCTLSEDDIFGCDHENMLNGVTCDDRNTNTDETRCLDGECVEWIQCEVDDGICCVDGRIVNEGGDCNSDSNGCTVDDSCHSGICTAGSAPNCSSEDDPCNTGVCSSSGNNTYTCIKNPTPHENDSCNVDSSGCTVDDSCQSGSCIAGSAPDCSSEDDQCNTGVCSSSGNNTYTCIKNSTPHENDSCNFDYNGCTVDDSCQSGSCTAGSTPDCSSEDDQCNTGVCSSSGNNTYTCIKNPTSHENDSCNVDSSGCTVDDSCQSGSCIAGSAPDCSSEDDQCNTGICSSSGNNTYACIKNPTTHENDLCNADSDGCTVEDRCQSGSCMAGSAPDCSLLNDQCNTGICVHIDSSSYQCEKDFSAFEGEDCNDDNASTGPDICVSGHCLGAGCTCAGINSCCDGCQPRNENAMCNADSNGCTLNDKCVAGFCSSGEEADCTDEDDQCNIGKCQSLSDSGYACLQDADPLDGEECNDGNSDTGPDICSDGTCTGSNCTCTGINLCCDGCQIINEGLNCNADSSGCTTNDTCQSGTCTAGTVADCSFMDDSCNSGICSSTGNTSYTCVKDFSTHEGQGCNDDTNACNGISTCVSGSCNQTTDPVSCTTLDECHMIGTCNTSTGICTDPVGHEGEVCEDDENACNGVNTCVSGSCDETTASVTCTALDECHMIGFCNHADGTCSNPNKDDGTVCETTNQCVSGTCKDCYDATGCDDLSWGEREVDCSERVCGAGNACEFNDATEGSECGTDDQCDTGICVDCYDTGGCGDYVEDSNACTDIACTNHECMDVNDDSNSCDLGYDCTDDHCVSGACEIETISTGCLIDETCVAEGESQDADGCIACDPTADEQGWSDMDGSSCAETSYGNPCVDAVCSGGTCVAQNDDTNTCPDSYSCTDTQCDGGDCILTGTNTGCFIDNICYAEGTPLEATGNNSCKACVSADSWDSWSSLGIGGSCNDDVACTFNDACTVDDICFGTSYDCNDHGSCNDGNDICTCDEAFAGDYCDECADGYVIYPICELYTFCGFNICSHVPPTNQTDCYTLESPWETTSCPGGIPASCGDDPAIEGCGQDAQYSDNSRTYTCYAINGIVQDPCDASADDNEVVTDSLTGLMWQRTYVTNKDWQEAIDYCEITLNVEPGYAGHTDWRLPNRFELQSLVDYGRHSPSIDIGAFSDTPSESFWSSSSIASSTGGAWYVAFSSGYVYYDGKTNNRYARCVRSGP